MLFMDTYSVKKEQVYLFSEGTSVSYSKFGFRIPVMIGWRFNLSGKTKLNLFTGPEMEVGYSGKTKYGGLKRDISYDIYAYAAPQCLRNPVFLWDVGAGLSFKKFYFGVTGCFGLSNINRATPNTYIENHIIMTLGMNLNTHHRKKRVTEPEKQP